MPGLIEDRVSAHLATLKGCQIAAGGRAKARPPETQIWETRTLKGCQNRTFGQPRRCPAGAPGDAGDGGRREPPRRVEGRGGGVCSRVADFQPAMRNMLFPRALPWADECCPFRASDRRPAGKRRWWCSALLCPAPGRRRRRCSGGCPKPLSGALSAPGRVHGRRRGPTRCRAGPRLSHNRADRPVHPVRPVHRRAPEAGPAMRQQARPAAHRRSRIARPRAGTSIATAPSTTRSRTGCSIRSSCQT